MATTEAKTRPATVAWTVRAKEFANCNCVYGCPCQFNARPSEGDCRAAVGYVIESGHFGKVKLDGLRAAGLYAWPGAVHEGRGTMQLIIDERANAEQRDALVQIMSGAHTDDMATVWWVYAAMCPNRLEPLIRPIEVEIDVDARRGRLRVPGLLEAAAQPILNPVTGDAHRVRIDMPAGFEYRLAEVGRGSTKASGAIPFDLEDSHAHFTEVHYNNHGIVA